MKILRLLSLLLIVFSCDPTDTNPQRIIDKTIEASGGKKYLNCTIDFDFRDRHYSATRDDGKFLYQRIFRDSVQTLHDFLSNDSFYREVNGTKVELPDSMAAKYTRSVNSVLYFALLPYGLNDPAVQKKFVGKTTMDGNSYYKIEITFLQEGGGEDHSDIFHYWINEKTFIIDFMSYLYYSEGGGVRLRKAINPRKVGGILFQDYINYKPENDVADPAIFYQMEEFYKQGKLVELSRVKLRNISVQ